MGDILITDTFSTYPTGEPIGTQELVVYDTTTREWQTYKWASYIVC